MQVCGTEGFGTFMFFVFPFFLLWFFHDRHLALLRCTIPNLQRGRQQKCERSMHADDEV
jgi:hypothetical protein